MDRHVKRAEYEAAGVPACWIADLPRPGRALLELGDGPYAERAVGDEVGSRGRSP